MKRFVGAALAAVALMGLATSADAQRYRRGETTVVQSAPAVDINTLLLLGAGGGLGTGGMSSLLPLLALQGQGTTTVIQEGGRRYGGWRPRGPRPVPGGTVTRRGR